MQCATRTESQECMAVAQLTSMAIVLPDTNARLTGHGNLNVDQLVVGVQVLQGALLPFPIQGCSPVCSSR